ncbi:hypothetical protein JM93_03278 [Roseibium hamelinense]|uniref:Uncharacterized protein n=1 Tax=Roseibium hamelinense TaxID=150831 RepID=A0A562SPB0_9HYPH|nr:hypothetical protein [Roseibium hamelinense]MTI44029.1 hypothetical protein [Roseibium hamelinense]TWI82764.1 hypothetical protein JM93_03278 [Roseibium hamelinense]
MPEVSGYRSSQALASSPTLRETQKVVDQLRELDAKQEVAVAQTVQRQADLSSNRAEQLARQVEQIERRVEARDIDPGLGGRFDITV